MARWWSMRLTLDAPIILAGVAGSLNDSHQAGSAWWISEVVDPVTGSRLAQSLFASESRCIITSVDTVVSSSAVKQALREQTGADLVDMESQTFAQCAAQRGATWAIVRGVSDGAQTNLPPNIDGWVNGDGQTRPSRVLWDLLKRPRDFGVIRKLNASSRRAMACVSTLLSDRFGK